MNYAIIGIVAIAIHLIMNHEFFKRDDKLDESNKIFKQFTIAALAYYVVDALWGIIYDLDIPALLYVDTIIYYLTMAASVVLLCAYVNSYLHLKSAFGKFVKYFGYVFGAAEVVLLIVNHFKHIFFWINPDGTYHPNPIRYVALVVQVLLCVLLSIQSGSAITKSTGEMKKRYFIILLFCIEMAIAIILQTIYPLVPFYSIGLVVGITIIHTFVKRSEREEQNKVLHSIANINYSMHEIDLVNDTVQEFNAKNHVKEIVNHSNGASKMMIQVMQETIDDSYLDKALEFTDLTTLAERMQGKKSISTQLLGKHFGWIMAMFITIEADFDEKPTKVLCTIRIIDDEKKREEHLISNSTMDKLTGLYNRRAYEDDLQKYPDIPTEPNFAYAAIDVNGLKTVNDQLGHDAGDELIKGAADCLQQTFGNHGKVYRIGGDEFAAMFFADEVHLESVQKDLENITLHWQGKLVESLSLSVGVVAKREFENKTVIDMAKLADERMYAVKEKYYSQKGIDRRGRAIAHTALCNLYTKILKVNLTDDSFSIINMDLSEQTSEKGFANTISGWLSGFGKSGQVHLADLDEYLQKTDINYLKDHFESGKTSITILYRRKYADVFKQVAMEMIPADDYSLDNQTLFLYVKDIDA